MLIVPTNPCFFRNDGAFCYYVCTYLDHSSRTHWRAHRRDTIAPNRNGGWINYVCRERVHWLDRIQLVLEYGWQRVDVWMYANFP